MKKHSWVYDAIAAVGWAVMSGGVGLLSLPAGIITAGLGLLIYAVLGAWLDGGKHAQ